MYCKLFSSVLVSILLSSTALADSFCGFDAGLIGTKAIGFVSPFELDTHKYEAGACELNVHESASEQAPVTVFKCTDFQHLPSPYIDNYETEGFDPLASDYFYFQVLDAKGNWAQLILKTGEKKWVKKKDVGDFSFPYQFKADEITASIDRTYPSQSAVYSQPRLDKPDPFHGRYLRKITDGWIDSQVSYNFFNTDLFTFLKKHDLFNPNHIEQQKLATHYGEFLHIAYDVTAIIRDEDGREWLQSKEVLEISYHDLMNYAYNGVQSQDGKSDSPELELSLHDLFQENSRSAPGRTVYFPYRDSSGTITMVMTDGPNCGC